MLRIKKKSPYKRRLNTKTQKNITNNSACILPTNELIIDRMSRLSKLSTTNGAKPTEQINRTELNELSLLISIYFRCELGREKKKEESKNGNKPITCMHSGTNFIFLMPKNVFLLRCFLYNNNLSHWS